MAQVQKRLCLGCSASSFDAHVILSVLSCNGMGNFSFVQSVEMGSSKKKILIKSRVDYPNTSTSLQIYQNNNR